MNYIFDKEYSFKAVFDNSAQQELYKSLINTSPFPIYVLDDKRYVFVNKAWEELFGYTLEEVTSPDFDLFCLIAPESQEVIKERYKLKDQLTENNPSEYVFTALSKSKRRIYINATVSRVIFQDKIVFQGLYKDVTKERLAEESLYNSRQMLNFIFNNIPQRIFLKDKNNVYFRGNKSFIKDIGLKSELDLIGLTDKDLPWKDQADKILKEDEIVYSGKPVFIESFSYTHDKNIHFIRIFKVPLKNISGKIIGLLGTYEDITDILRDINEKKSMLQELEKAKNEAEEMNRVKSMFFANMSHELRTPLVGILGYSQILTEELEDESLKSMSESILKGGNRLLETLNLILDLSRIEANKMEINYTKCNLVKFVEEISFDFSAAAKLKNLSLITRIEEKELYINIDERHLINILNNLINNAIKFTEKGSVTVTVKKEKNWAVIKVADTGIGIARDKRSVIFEAFRQASEGMSRNFEGTGLGLTLTKKFVELMNGKIELESTLSKGTCFTVRFPVFIPSQSQE